MITTSQLDSGIRLCTETMPGVESVCIGYWVGTGPRDESPAQAGISHFLEHLLFKGTPTRSARAIAEAVDGVGGDMNAYTTREYTTFYMRLLADDLELGLDVLSDIMLEPALRPDEVDAERRVILEEVLMHLDEPADVVQERFFEAMFPNHPLGREVLGLADVITSVTVPEIRAFFDEHYRPGNIVVAAAGNVEHDRLVDELERRFADRSPGQAPARTAPEDPAVPLDVVTRDTEQAHLVLGVRAPDRHAPERYALALMNHTLGGGLSSRLFQRVREERGLAYSIISEPATYADAGTLAVSVGTAPERVDEVLTIVREELDALAAEGVSDAELDLAKRHVRADTVLSLEDSGARMARLGASMLLQGEVLELSELARRVEAVTTGEIAELAGRVLGGPRTLAAVGPFGADDLTAAFEG